MPISLKLKTDAFASKLKPVLHRLLGQEVASLEMIGGGRNSRVYRAVDVCAGCYAVKVYFSQGSDIRDRIGVEYRSLHVLWEHGFRCIPRPITMDREFGCAVYEYVDGKPIQRGQAIGSDVTAAVEFLSALKNLSKSIAEERFPPAAEACFSAHAVAENVGQRLAKLQASMGSHGPLREFLDHEFSPMWEKIVPWSENRFESEGLRWWDPIVQEERTLSPSDFGFHNAIRRSVGDLVFLDFEYFGWDDPAKMISDFLLHPGMDLSEESQRQFFTGVLTAHYPSLRKRVECLYPLLGLKWCLILLNEFLPEHLQRRGFAYGQDLDRDVLQHQQLAKAVVMLNKIKGEYEQFPYH